MAADSFNGIDIVIYYSGNIQIDDVVDMTVQHFPGGNNAVIDVGGNLPPVITMTLFFATSADYQTMRAQLGQQGQLSILQNMDTPETYLAALQSMTRETLNLGTKGETTAQAVFQVIA